jgi:hypothetical protein
MRRRGQAPPMRSLLMLAGTALLSAACMYGNHTEAAATPTPTRQAIPALCEPAPAWLVEAVQTGITTEGASLGNAYVVPAGAILDGPPIVLGSDFADAQLIVGIITGRGAR